MIISTKQLAAIWFGTVLGGLLGASLSVAVVAAVTMDEAIGVVKRSDPVAEKDPWLSPWLQVSAIIVSTIGGCVLGYAAVAPRRT